MSWADLILVGLKLVLALVDWAKGKQQFNAGQDAEIAKNALAILDKTEARSEEHTSELQSQR